MASRYLRYFRSRTTNLETDDAILDGQVRAAFPHPETSPALQTRVAELCRAAAAPDSQERGLAAAKRRLWMNAARWGTIGLAATAVTVAWLSGRSGDSAAVAAVLNAMASAPVIHAVGIGDRGSRSEEWIADGVGLAYHSRDSEKEEIMVDDLTYQYIFVSPVKRVGRFNPYGEPHVQIMPSQMADPRGAAQIRDGSTGNGILKALREGKSGKGLKVRAVTENGRHLRQILLPGYRAVETITIDPETDRILRQEMEGPNVIDAPERIRLTFEYPDPAGLDRSRFHFDVPAGVSVEDSTDGPVRWTQGNMATCMNQLKALKEGLRRYANIHHGQWPENLRPALDSYVDSLAVFRCPLAQGTKETSYEYHQPGKMLAPRVLAFWNRWKANPRLIDSEAGRLGGVRPGMIECHLHSGTVLSLYYNGNLIRWTPTPERPGVTLATEAPSGPPPSDPRLVALRKALEAREQRLSRLSVTFDSRAEFLVPTSVWAGPPTEGLPSMPPRGPGEFMHTDGAWAQNGKRTLFDEKTWMLRPSSFMRRRVVSDGETVLSQYFQRPDDLPKPANPENAREPGSNASAAPMLGLAVWGRRPSALLNGSVEVRYLGVQSIDADRCVALELTDRAHPGSRARIWFDAGHGYMLRREQDYNGPHLQNETIAAQPRKVAPGLFLATRLTAHAYLVKRGSPALEDGRPTPPTHRQTTVVRQASLGPLPDRLFQPLSAR
jgi:hypothetical protein